MTTFELIKKNRMPIKFYAVSGFLIGIILLILIGFSGEILNGQFKKVLIGILIGELMFCIFILNYSFKVKKVIGQISFSEEYIEIELYKKIERIYNNNIHDIRFELAGYEGLNKTSISQGLGIFGPLSYHSGLENFIYIKTTNEYKTFEFYISNKRQWININRIVTFYLETFTSKNK